MKAAVLCEQPGDLVIEDLLIDKPGPQEVLIQTVGAGLCHSDLHMMEGLFAQRFPQSWDTSRLGSSKQLVAT